MILLDISAQIIKKLGQILAKNIPEVLKRKIKSET